MALPKFILAYEAAEVCVSCVQWECDEREGGRERLKLTLNLHNQMMRSLMSYSSIHCKSPQQFLSKVSDIS